MIGPADNRSPAPFQGEALRIDWPAQGVALVTFERPNNRTR